ncbi:hypothetical protein [Limosilactobacillus fermentum]
MTYHRTKPFIFQADQLVVANQAGQLLSTPLDLDLDYLQELAHTAQYT